MANYQDQNDVLADAAKHEERALEKKILNECLSDYEIRLAKQIENLIDWIIDNRGWSRLNCAGEAAFATRKRYEEIGKSVNQPS